MADHLAQGLINLSRVCAVLILAGVTGCSEPEHGAPALPDIGARFLDWERERLNALIDATDSLERSTHAFLELPGEDTASEWQADWRTAHELYLEAIVFRKPVSHLRIDAWPIEPGFLDSLPDYPESGIVNDTTLKLSPDVLAREHLITDASEVVFGFHVIEYYAFERQFSDFSATAARHQERHELLRIVTRYLTEDIRKLTRNDNAESPPVNHEALLRGIYRTSKALVSEVNLQTHASFSGESMRSIEVQLTAIRELLGERIGLNNFLIEMNPGSARELNRILNDAIRLLGSYDDTDEETEAHLLLLLVSIPQQLEEFVRMLPGESQV